jgi:hypothetical protein
MAVPPLTDGDGLRECSGETTVEEECWRDDAVDVVDYRAAWADELLENRVVAVLVSELGSRPGRRQNSSTGSVSPARLPSSTGNRSSRRVSNQ